MNEIDSTESAENTLPAKIPERDMRTKHTTLLDLHVLWWSTDDPQQET
jgi:hypothetical protein